VAKNIEEGKVGGLFNINQFKKIKEVQKIAVEKAIENPLLFGMDVIHGYETFFQFLWLVLQLGYEIDRKKCANCRSGSKC
jgi:hypothetical protein